MGLFTADSGKDDAIALLVDDHRNVKALFKQFEELKEGDADDEEKAQLVQEICVELTLHALLEEEIFYPAVRKAIDDDDMMDEAEVEHSGAKALIVDLMTGKPGAEQFEAKVTVLGEYIDHHVKEEENEMFPKARKAVDTQALGRKMAARKAALLAEMARETNGASPATREDGTSRASARRTN